MQETSEAGAPPCIQRASVPHGAFSLGASTIAANAALHFSIMCSEAPSDSRSALSFGEAFAPTSIASARCFATIDASSGERSRACALFLMIVFASAPDRDARASEEERADRLAVVHVAVERETELGDLGALLERKQRAQDDVSERLPQRGIACSERRDRKGPLERDAVFIGRPRIRDEAIDVVRRDQRVDRAAKPASRRNSSTISGTGLCASVVAAPATKGSNGSGRRVMYFAFAFSAARASR